MGADKATFAVDRAVDQDRKSRDRMWRQSRDRKYIIRMRNGSCALSALVGPFDRNWKNDVTGRGPDRKYVLRIPGFFPRFFLSSSPVVTWVPDVTKDHLTHLRGSLGCAHHP
jgi:hypothetical protein